MEEYSHELCLEEKELVGLMEACQTYYLALLGQINRAITELPGKRSRYAENVYADLQQVARCLVGPDRSYAFNIMDPAVPEDARIAFDLHASLAAETAGAFRPPFSTSREVPLPGIGVTMSPGRSPVWCIELSERHIDVILQATDTHARIAEGDLSSLRSLNLARQPGHLPQAIDIEEADRALDRAEFFFVECGILAQSRGSKRSQSAVRARKVHRMIAGN